MERQFQLAASHLETLIPSLAESTKDLVLLYLYSRYKQATVGPCNTPKPNILSFTARKKWSCWNNLQSMSKEEAMKEYVEKIQHLDPSWDPGSTKPLAGMGVSVSILNHGDEEVLNDNEKDVFDWCKEGSLQKVTSLLPEKMPMDDEGRTLLHWACDRGHLKIAQFLIQVGHDCNCLDMDHSTPLHYASKTVAYQRRVKPVLSIHPQAETLVCNNVKGMLACAMSAASCIDNAHQTFVMLCEEKSQAFRPGHDFSHGRTALWKNCRGRRVRLVYERGRNTEKDRALDKGSTLWEIKQNGRCSWCCAFLRSQNGYILDRTASSCDHCDIIALLLNHKADTTAKDCDGETPMDCASSMQARKLFEKYSNEQEKII